ncbi:MAG: coenzyme F420-0:L-glutamate ligase [Candidatus Dormibacteraceae bacterium]
MSIQLLPVVGLPEIQAGADLAQLITNRIELQESDVLVIAQKIISKAEGRFRSLAEVIPEPRALELGERLGRDPRLVQLVLDESTRLLREERVLISETRQGFICANAGIDQSNVPGEDTALLLPEDCDRSAARLRQRLIELSGCQLAVIISDTFGRPWRLGQVNVALGVAGIAPIADHRGRKDDFGREMEATEVAVADELTSAAELVTGKTERVPVVVIRGFPITNTAGSGQDLLRSKEEDLFR